MSGKATDLKSKAQQDKSARPSGPNEGEGSQTGARRYDEATRAFVASGKVKKAADDAERALSGPEAESLKKAEEEGKKHSHGEDPLPRR